MARPRIQIDERQVELLAGVGCTVHEIAAALDVSHDTIERRFASLIEKGRGRMRSSLRRKQVERAMKGSDTMLIWLGKNLLGQTDKLDATHTGTMVHEHRDADEEAILVAADRIRERRRVGPLTS